MMMAPEPAPDDDMLVANYLFWLAVLYFAVAAVVVAQLSRILYFKHNLYSFQFTFLVLCLVWSLMRGVYFIIIESSQLPIMLETVMYWLPVNVEFATISMLVVFYASLAHKSTWRKRNRARVLAAYALTNALFFCTVLAQWVYFLLTREGSLFTTSPAWLGVAQRVFVLVMYLVLAVTLHVYMMKVVRVANEPSIKVALQSSRLSPSALLITNSVIVILFLSRCAYLTVTLLMNVGNFSRDRSSAAAGGGVDSPTGHLVTLVTHVIWEIVPTSLIIASFWKIPATGRARFKPNLAATPHDADKFSYQTLPDAASSVFSNPLRYDSDEDLLGERQPLIGDDADIGPLAIGAGAAAERHADGGSMGGGSLARSGASYATPASYGSVSSLLGEPQRYGSINSGASGDVRQAYSPYSTTPFGRTPPVHKPIETQLPSGAKRTSERRSKSRSKRSSAKR